jgi:hypothetical protein
MKQRPPFGRRLGWMVLIWMASVSALTAVAAMIHLVLAMG